MPRTTKTITFSLPPDMADRVDEEVKQQGRSGANSSVRRCSDTWKNASGGNCSSTGRRGLGPRASDPVTWPAWSKSTGTRSVIPKYDSGPGHHRNHLRPELPRQRASGPGTDPAGTFGLCWSQFILEEAAGVWCAGLGGRRNARPGPSMSWRTPSWRTPPPSSPPTPCGDDTGRPLRQPGVGVRRGCERGLSGDRRHLLPIGEHAEMRILNAPRFLSSLGER